jgi:hypothetical protein
MGDLRFAIYDCDLRFAIGDIGDWRLAIGDGD